MDNVRDRAQVEPLIPPAPCVLLVTSRQHFTLPGMFDQNLDALPRADAIKLLLAIAGRIGERADEIARLCGDLPLALRVAASALAERPNLAPADYARRLADAKQRLSHLKEVDVALNLSYELLNEEQRRLWRALAVFPQSFDDAAAAAVWQMEGDAAQDALGDLMKWSLVEFSAETGRYRLHDLAGLFAEARLSEAGSEETDAAQRCFAWYFYEVLATCNSLYEEGDEAVVRGLARFDQEWGNIQAGQAWAEACAGQDDRAAELCIKYTDAGIELLLLRQHPREYLHWQEVALVAARKLNSHRSEGNALGNLGNAYAILGELRKAIKFYQQQLVISREARDHKGVGNALCNLGIAHKNLGESHKAIKFQDQALTIFREIGDRKNEGRALSNLGSAHFKLGELRKAIEFYEQALTIRREIGDRKGEGIDLGNLGTTYAALGEARIAIGFYERVLEIDRVIGDRRSEGADFWNLCLILENTGNRTQAIALAEAALKIFEAIESPHAERVRNQLAEWREQVRAE